VVLATALAGCGGGGGGGGQRQSGLQVSAVDPPHGPALTRVTLSGSGFSAAPSEDHVELNNMTCTVVAATPTELTVEVPRRAGSGTFQVTVQADTAASPIFTYDVTSVTVGTIAGSSFGFVDDVGAAARFASPAGVAIDQAGTIFVADAGNHAIREVFSDGSVVTLAGGTEGAADGKGVLAQFYEPSDLAFDSGGNLFVIDPGSPSGTPSYLRKIAPDGVVSTALSAGLSVATGVTSGGGQLLVIADRGNSRILADDLGTGTLDVVAGGTVGDLDGTGTAARFQFPSRLTFCPDGNLFVADTNNMKIRKIAPGGVVTTYAGSETGVSYADGDLTTARFLFPAGLACDESGKLYVADSENNAIRMITPSGIVTTLAGHPGSPGYADGDGATAKFSLPAGIAVEADGALVIGEGTHVRLITWE